MPSEEVMVPESKDIEIIEYSSPPISAAEKKSHVLSSLGPTTGASESCMFSSPHLNRLPVEEKPNILPPDQMVFNFKTEHRNGDATYLNPKHSEHDHINLIKQFLMGEDNQPPPNSCRQLESPLQVDGGIIHDSPPPWADYPVDASSVLSELNFHQGNRSTAPYPPCPQQNGKQPSFHMNGYDQIPGMIQGQANGGQCGGPQPLDSTNIMYPFLPDMSNHANTSMSNPYVNGVHTQDICDVHVQTSMNGLNQVLQNGTDFLPPYLRQEGTVIHSLQQRFGHNQNGFYHPKKEGNFTTATQLPNGNHHSYDFMGHASVTEITRQDPSMCFGPPNNTHLNHNPQVPQVEEVLSVDDLTPSLFTDPMVPYGNPENFHNGHLPQSMHSTGVYPPSEMHLSQSVGQSFQTPQQLQQKSSAQNQFQPASNNSLLKRMLTL